MPYIDLKNKQIGIRALLEYAPEVGKPLADFMCEVMEHNSIGLYEACVIAAHIFWNSKCTEAFKEHIQYAERYVSEYGEKFDYDLTESIIEGQLINRLDPKAKSMLMLSDDVRLNIKPSKQSIDFCKHNLCTDKEIHDVVLITATTCMIARYTSGLDVDK